jgi:predicted nucleic acid-binding protein
MILVDTSVWIDHLRKGNTRLNSLLLNATVLIHPFVIGELACGNLHNRNRILNLLGDLPASRVADDREVLFFIERNELMGRGIGYIDAHLLASVSLSDAASLWTVDRKLNDVAVQLGLSQLG